MKEKIIFTFSFMWTFRIVFRVFFIGIFLLILLVLAKGATEIAERPGTFFFIWGVYAIFNLFEIPTERKKVKKITIDGERIVIVKCNNEESTFNLSDIYTIEQIDRKHGFGGFRVAQLLIRVEKKGDFEVSMNIKNFKQLCNKLSVIDVDKLDFHEPVH